MNSHILKITGSSELPEPLELSKDYLISINAGIDSVKKQSGDQDGFEYIYSAKQRTCEILKDNGQVMKAQVKNSKSKQLRSAIWSIQQEVKPEMDEEDFYNLVMGQIFKDLDLTVKKSLS